MGKIFIGSKIIPKKNPIKKLIRCCSCKKEYDFKGNIFSSNKGKMLICPYCGLKHRIDFKLFKDKLGNLIKINGFNLTAIDVGSPAVEGDTTVSTGETYIDTSNPANESGIITSIEVWANEDLENFEVATFYLVSGNNYSTRDTHTIGPVTGGSKQTFSGLSINVEAGDFIGFYASAGKVRLSIAGGASAFYFEGDSIPCTDVTFSGYGNHRLSVYGIGTTEEGEVKNATGKSDITSSFIVTALSRGKVEDASGKSDLTSDIIVSLSRGKIESVSGIANIASDITIILSRGKIENVSGKADITSNIDSSIYRIVKANAKSSITTSIESLLSRGRIESVTGKSDVSTSIDIILSRGKIESVSGKSDINSIISIVLSKGKIKNATGKVSITSDITAILNRGKIEDATGIASIITSIDVLLSMGKIIDTSGKSQFDTNIDTILHRIIPVDGKATLNTLCDIIISRGEIVNANGKAYIYTSIGSKLSKYKNVNGKADINSLINIDLKRILNASGKSIFDTLIEIEVMRGIIFTQATLGIEQTRSKFNIINVTAKTEIKE